MADEEATEITEEDRVVQWRAKKLIRVGVDSDVALELAERHDTGVDEVLALVAGGCPAGTAARIVR